MTDRAGREQEPERIAYKRAYYERRKAYFAQKRREQWQRIKDDPEAHERQRLLQQGYDRKRAKPTARPKVEYVDSIRLLDLETAPDNVRAEMKLAKQAWLERFAPDHKLWRWRAGDRGLK